LVYEEFGGLRTGIEQDGSISYANELLSTGTDESFIVRFGLIIYLIPLFCNVFLIIKRSISRLPVTYQSWLQFGFGFGLLALM
jgi:hypothetical protein